MKKLLCVLLVLCMTLSLASCGVQELPLDTGGLFDAVGDFFDGISGFFTDMADSVGGFFDGLFSKAPVDGEPADPPDTYDPYNPPLTYDTESPADTDVVDAPGNDEPDSDETEAPESEGPVETEAPKDTEPPETEPAAVSRQITVYDIRVTPPKSGTYQLGSSAETGLNITVQGPRSVVEALTPEDLTVTADLGGYPTETEGTVYVPVSVTVREPYAGKVDISGSYFVPVSFNVRPVLYVYTGHSADTWTKNLRAYLEENGFVLKKTDDISSVPVNQNTVLLLYDLKEDLTKAEADVLEGYFYRGGRAVLITDYRRFGGEEQKMLNLLSVMKTMGLSAQAGMILEVERTQYYAAPNMLLPSFVGDGPAKNLVFGQDMVLLTDAHAIREESGSKAQTAAFLQTSDIAFLKEKVTLSGYYTKAPTDPTGTFTVAATSQLGKARLVWFATPGIVKEQENTHSSYANFRLFLNSLFWAMENS